MRVYDQGSFIRVTMSANEVQDWKRYWPCSGLPSRGVSFTFDRRNWDLVDTNVSQDADGPATVALSHDAQKYAQSKLA